MIAAWTGLAGNLATSQGVMAKLKADIRKDAKVTLDTVGSLTEAADYLGDLRQSWDNALKTAFRQMPPLSWATNWDKSGHERSGAC